MRRFDLLVSLVGASAALVASKCAAFARQPGRLETAYSSVGSNLLECNLRSGRGEGQHNSAVLQRAIDDAALTGGTIRIPRGRFEIAAAVMLVINPDQRPSKSIEIVGDAGAVLLMPGDYAFAVTHSPSAPVGRVQIRNMQFEGLRAPRIAEVS